MRPFRQSQSGQSLLEAIIGITILISGLVTSLSLGILTIRAGQVSLSRTIADNLAREGIELVRSIRDTNWLKGDAWDSGLCVPLDPTAGLILDPVQFTWALDRAENSIDDSNALVYLNNDTVNRLVAYVQYASDPPADAVATKFRRLITIVPNGAGCSDVPGPTNYTVTVKVQWEENGSMHDSTLEETLFNWRS